MSLIEVSLQTTLAFLAVFLYARILGKQQVGQLTVFEYITGITFGSIAAALALETGPKETWYNFLGLTLFFLLTYLMGHVTLISRPVRKLVSGEPTIVIHNGKMLEGNMKKMQYNMDELTMQLREKGYFDLTQGEYAILETNGALSVLPKSQHRPLMPRDLGLETRYEGVVAEIIVDGQVVYQNLVQNNLDEKWLLEELMRRGIQDLREVSFAGLTSDGNLYVDKVQDELGQQPTDISDLPNPQVPPDKKVK
ncbi:MAG TPA: DUF421 domain-containing protein [Clostridia bacterium]|nr:DUF421 domain-containing protein [Clostridia bacterium]